MPELTRRQIKRARELLKEFQIICDNEPVICCVSAAVGLLGGLCLTQTDGRLNEALGLADGLEEDIKQSIMQMAAAIARGEHNESSDGIHDE